MTSTKILILECKTLLDSFPEIEAAWLTGSYGRGDFDVYSDVDIVAYVADEGNANLVFDDVVVRIAQRLDVIHHKILPWGGTINAITQDWQRFDISIASQQKLVDYCTDDTRFLFDKMGIAAQMAKSLPPRTNAQIVRELILATEEFIRILGLLPIVIGRENNVGATAGVQLLKDLLIKIMMLKDPLCPVRGALALRQSITSDDYDRLSSMPPVIPTREGLLSANKMLAGMFFNDASILYNHYNIEWPARFVNCTFQHLHNTLGLNIINLSHRSTVEPKNINQ